MDFSATFDSTNALSYMFLWLLFGFLGTMVNCDIQRWMRTHPIAFHAFGFLAFFFLFTLLDTNNASSIGVIWAKTVFVYALFVLMTKAKWYFVLPVLALLLFDQSVKKHVAFKKAEAAAHGAAAVVGDGKHEGDAAAKAAGDAAAKTYADRVDAFQQKVTQVVNVSIFVMILAGALDYMRLQRLEYGSDFSFYKFFMTTANTCKEVAPDYARAAAATAAAPRGGGK